MEGLSKNVKASRVKIPVSYARAPKREREREPRKRRRRVDTATSIVAAAAALGFVLVLHRRTKRAELRRRRRLLPVARGGLNGDPSTGLQRERKKEGAGAAAAAERPTIPAAGAVPPPHSHFHPGPHNHCRSRRRRRHAGHGAFRGRLWTTRTDVVMAGVRKEELSGRKVLPTAAAAAAAVRGEQRDSTVALRASLMLDADAAAATQGPRVDGVVREDSHAICAAFPYCAAKVGKRKTSKTKNDRLVISCVFDIQREMNGISIYELPRKGI